jgi:site-specific DNA-methyltransferase (adenine-specific)
MEYLIETYTNPGDLVIDPFGGSGTTAVACARQGRRCICIEREAEFYDIMVKRLNLLTGISKNAG